MARATRRVESRVLCQDTETLGGSRYSVYSNRAKARDHDAAAAVVVVVSGSKKFEGRRHLSRSIELGGPEGRKLRH